MVINKILKRVAARNRTLANKLSLLACKAKFAARIWQKTDTISFIEKLTQSRQALNIYHEIQATSPFITPGEGMALYSVVREFRPLRVVEIGLAHGYSSLYILKGLQENGGGQLISIDPFQFGSFTCGVGLMNVYRAGYAALHRLINSYSQYALPELVQKGDKFDFAFVDGSHLFDYTLVDFFFLDKLLKVGGVIAFHDYCYPAVYGVLQFVERNFSYTPLATNEKNVRILQKQADDSRPDFHFTSFKVPDICWSDLENRVFVDTTDPTNSQPCEKQTT